MLLGIFLSMYVREPFVSHGLISCIRLDDGGSLIRLYLRYILIPETIFV